MNEIPITACGRLTADPDLVYRRDGVAVARMTVEVLERRQTPDGWRLTGRTQMECRAWGALAKHVQASLREGDHVVVVGRLRQRAIAPGTSAYDVVLTSAGASLAFTNVQIARSDPGASGPAHPGDARCSQTKEQSSETRSA